MDTPISLHKKCIGHIVQHIVNTVKRIIGASLPSLQDIYTTRLPRTALISVKDTDHPAHELLSLLPSGKRYRSLRSQANRLANSVIHQAVRLLNSLPTLPSPTDPPSASQPASLDPISAQVTVKTFNTAITIHTGKSSTKTTLRHNRHTQGIWNLIEISIKYTCSIPKSHTRTWLHPVII